MIEANPAMLATLAIDFGNALASASPSAGGPPSDLPGPVPDFVGDILGGVREFIGGGVDRLGSLVSSLTPGSS